MYLLVKVKSEEKEWERRTQQRVSHDSSMVGEDG